MDKKNKILLTSLGMFSFMQASIARAMTSAPCVSSLIQITAITTPLHFGSIDCTAGSGSVIVNPNNGTATGAGCIATVGGTPGQAQVRVIAGQGSSQQKIRVNLTSTAITINNGGAQTMPVTAIQFKGKDTATINGNATKTYSIGGTLNINSTDPNGTYTGTVSVSAVCL